MNGVMGKPSDEAKARHHEIVRWAAERGMAITMHWSCNDKVDELLGIFSASMLKVPSRICDGRSHTSTMRRRARWSA